MAHIPQRHLCGDGRRVARRAEVMAEPPLEPRLCRRATLGRRRDRCGLARLAGTSATSCGGGSSAARSASRGGGGRSEGSALRASVTVVGELRPLGTEGSSGGDSTTTLDNTGLSVDTESWMGFVRVLAQPAELSERALPLAAAALRSARRRARAPEGGTHKVARAHKLCAHRTEPQATVEAEEADDEDAQRDGAEPDDNPPELRRLDAAEGSRRVRHWARRQRRRCRRRVPRGGHDIERVELHVRKAHPTNNLEQPRDGHRGERLMECRLGGLQCAVDPSIDCSMKASTTASKCSRCDGVSCSISTRTASGASTPESWRAKS